MWTEIKLLLKKQTNQELPCLLFSQTTALSELMIIGGNEDNSKINFLISHLKHSF